jgi:hypothetical protein
MSSIFPWEVTLTAGKKIGGACLNYFMKFLGNTTAHKFYILTEIKPYIFQGIALLE